MAKFKPQKNPEKFNSVDLRDYWCAEYNNRHQEPYQTHGYIGNELHLLKQLFEQQYDVYIVLLAINNAVKNKEISIKWFVESFDFYFRDSVNAKIEFYVLKYGEDEQKQIWNEIGLSDAMWLKTSFNIKEKRKLIEQLENWVKELQNDNSLGK